MAAVGDVYEITDQFELAAKVALLVSHHKVTATGGAGLTDRQIATMWAARMSGTYCAWMPPEADYLGVKAQKIFPLPRLIAGVETLAAQIGTAVNEPLPPQCAGLVQVNDGLSGKGNRGRKYIPFPARDWLDTVAKEGGMNAAGIAALGNVAAQLSGVFTLAIGPATVSFQIGLWSRKTAVFTPVNANLAADAFATQRRRSFFHKPQFGFIG